VKQIIKTERPLTERTLEVLADIPDLPPMSPNGTVAICYDKVETESVEIDPDLASVIFAECHEYEFQREPDKRRVAQYALAMKRHQFEVADIKIHHCQGRQYLTDGQHRLLAVLHSGATVLQNVCRLYTNDFEVVRLAFQNTDNGYSRSLGQRLKATDIGSTTGLGERQNRAFASAVLVLMDGFRSTSPASKLNPFYREPAQRAVIMTAYTEEARKYMAAITGTSFFFKAERAAVFALGLVTYRYQPEAAARFWPRVAMNQALELETGEWHLRSLLENPNSKKMRPNELARRVAICWNAYFEQEPLKKLIIKNLELPISISGTPYTSARFRPELP
jgi:hypothetical protein